MKLDLDAQQREKKEWNTRKSECLNPVDFRVIISNEHKKEDVKFPLAET